MSLRGQRFELDLDADDFTPRPLASPTSTPESTSFSLIADIKERSPAGPPVPPSSKHSTTGFPAHKKRFNGSAFKQQRSAHHPDASKREGQQNQNIRPGVQLQHPPSDKAIVHHLGKKYGYDMDGREKQEISDENKQRIAHMSEEDIDDARAELMSSLNPALIEKLLRRANINEDIKDIKDQDPIPPPEPRRQTPPPPSPDPNQPSPPPNPPQPPPSQSNHDLTPPIHFPSPPIDPSTFTALDPSSPNFLHDLKTHYFPSTPHSPSTLHWLTPPTDTENETSAYHPSQPNYPLSSLRFSFPGTLIPPTESLTIPTGQGLHHHGLAPASAGYTVPELALLARSAMPSQRCLAHQVLGRLVYRLGRGDFGVPGGELYEGLWELVEKERVVEIWMAEAEANGTVGGHMSAKAYAVEALWLWRRGCGGERGLLRDGAKRAK